MAESGWISARILEAGPQRQRVKRCGSIESRLVFTLAWLADVELDDASDCTTKIWQVCTSLDRLTSVRSNVCMEDRCLQSLDWTSCVFHPQVRCLVFHALQLAIADELRHFPTTAISYRVFLRVHGERVRFAFTNAKTVKLPEPAERPLHKARRVRKSVGVDTHAEEAVQASWITGEISRSPFPLVPLSPRVR